MKNRIEQLEQALCRALNLLTDHGIDDDLPEDIAELWSIYNHNTPLANRHVIFESWTVADLREMLENVHNDKEEEKKDFPTLSRINDEQFYDLLNYLSGKDLRFTSGDGTHFDWLEEFAETYFKE